MNNQSNLNNPRLTAILFAILVKRLGGKIKITQTDIDEVAYNHLEEEGFENGDLEFCLIERSKSS